VVASALGNKDRAHQYFRSAHLINPAKVVDPRVYPPRTIRAYNSACAAGERIAPAPVVIKSVPTGATFKTDGNPVDPSGNISLSPGRHVVEAILTGYAHTREVIEIDADGVGPKELTLTLTKLPDLTAWEHLRKEISSPPYDMTRPGLEILFERFDIDHVIILEPKGEGLSGFKALFATPGQLDLTSLPELDLLATPVPIEFVNGLRGALGLAPQEIPPEPKQPRVIVPPLDPNALEEDEESEEASVRFTATDEVPKDDSDLEKIFTSPWFWVSVGIATAMVTGVVVGTQID
jgi:hypothetical protein